MDMRPSAYLTRIMLDESAPLAARIMCAGKVIPFVERKPEPTPPGEIPLMREWTNEQWESFERRTREDMVRDPGYYGREALEQMGLDRRRNRNRQRAKIRQLRNRALFRSS